MADIEKYISKRIDRAILQYNLIEPNDKILLAISGGKDSLTMAYHLFRKSKNYRIPFSIEAVHVKTDMPNASEEKKFFSLLEEWGGFCDQIDVPVQARLKEGKKLSCYWCSTQRRKELLEYAKLKGCNKIALGHHMDDILETLFMNMAYKGEMSTMIPSMKYEKFDYTVIRPLSLIEEKDIIKFSKEMGFSSVTCQCNFDTTSQRHPVRRAIEELAIHKSVKKNLYKSMSNIVEQYLPK